MASTSYSVSFHADVNSNVQMQSCARVKSTNALENMSLSSSSSCTPSTSTNVIGPVEKEPLKPSQIKRILQGQSLQSVSKGQCRVCESHETGVHFGTILCSPCSQFFRNALDSPVDYLLRPCITGRQRCLVVKNCHPCMFCRVKKCLSVGLTRNTLFPETRVVKPNDKYLRPQEIGVIDCPEMVKRLRKAGVWAGLSKKEKKRLDTNIRYALRRKISTRWDTKYKAVHKTAADKGPQRPIPVLPKGDSSQPQPQLYLIIPATDAVKSGVVDAGAVTTLVSNSDGALVSQLDLNIVTDSLFLESIRPNLEKAIGDLLIRVKPIREGQQLPVAAYVDVNPKAKRLLYNNSDRPVLEHWRRLETHFNELLCSLVKFAKSLSDFESLSGDEQHTLLSGTLLDMMFIASVFFLDETSKRFYLSSGLVYSLQYLCNAFSGCSGAGDFFRSMFDFSRRLLPFITSQNNKNEILVGRLGLLLALTLYSPPPSSNLQVTEKQKRCLDILKSDIDNFSNPEENLSSLLACLSCLGTLTIKHKRMVKSVRDTAGIHLAVDLHAELLDLGS